MSPTNPVQNITFALEADEILAPNSVEKCEGKCQLRRPTQKLPK